MPIAIDPNQKVRVILPTDENKEPQPAFVFKPLTLRHHRECNAISAQLDSLNENDTVPENLVDDIYTLISNQLIGLENMPGDQLEDIITLQEMFLLFVLMNQCQPSIDLKKKSESQSPSSSESCAAVAREQPDAADH